MAVKQKTVGEKIKTILVSQPKPQTGKKSPYFDLEEKCKLKVDFRSFIHVEGVEGAEIRKDQKVRLDEYTAVILTSRVAADHYFRVAKEMHFTVPDDMKYFCTSESTALYLQNYIQYRKRKIFHGKVVFADLIPLLKKHKKEKFLLPSTDILKPTIPKLLEENKIEYKQAVMYKTVCSDLSDLENVFYDMLVFYSPSGIKSLLQNFPDFDQQNTRIAAFGPTTAKAVEDAGLRLDVRAPNPKAPSMTMAIDQFVKELKKKKK